MMGSEVPQEMMYRSMLASGLVGVAHEMRTAVELMDSALRSRGRGGGRPVVCVCVCVCV